MAARFWVTGGTGNWNDTTNWASTSGGASGASVPGSADTAALDANSGAGTVTLDISPTIQTLTCTGFTGTLAFGTNTISLNSTGTIFTGATTMTVTGTPLIICTNTGTSGRTINATAVTEANSISFRIAGNTGTLAFGAGAIRDIDFTDGTNPTGYGGTLGTFVVTIYGSLKASTNMLMSSSGNVMTFAATSGVKTINTAGITTDRPFTFNGVGGTWQLQSNINTLSPNSTRTCTLTNGTLDLNGYTATFGAFSSTNSNIRTLTFGAAGKLVLTQIGTATIYTTATATNLTLTGSRRVEITGAAIAGGTRTITGPLLTAGGSAATAMDFFISDGDDSINLGTANRAYRTIDFTGFSGSTAVNVAPQLYGSLVLSSTMTVSGSSNIWGFLATDAQTITTDGVTLDANITFDGVGGTWDLLDALTAGATRTLTLTNGTFKTNGFSVSGGAFSSSNTNVRTLNLGASTVTLATNGTAWNITDPTNLTFTGGTSSLLFTDTTNTVTFQTGGLTYYNVTAPDSGYRFDVVGSSTFNQFTASNSSTLADKPVRFNTNQTFGTFTVTGASGNCRVLIFANPTIVGSQITLTATSASFVDVDFRDIAAAGAVIPWSGTRLGDYGNNTNITFGAGKTVYWNKVAGGNWGDNAWALTSGGATSTLNQPLGQDTAVFDNTGLTAGSTVVVGNYVAGGLNCSSLTNALIIQTDATYLAPGFYKDVVLSSAVSFTGTTNIGFSSRATTQNVTSAGVNWACGVTFNATGTVVLVDNLTSDDASFTSGSINLNGKILACNTFSGTGTATRSIAFNSGQIDVTGSNATVWSCADLTNFSYTGTPTVNFTYSGSTGSRTINHGGTAGGTEANAVDFNVVAGGDTVGMNNNGGCRNFTVQSAFTGATGLFSSGYIYGNLLLSPNQTINATTNTVTFAATSGTKTITTNGVTIDRPLVFDGLGGSWQLGDALTMGATNGTLYFYRGTFSTANYAVTAARWFYDYITILGTVVLNLGSSTITLIGTQAIPWQMGNAGPLTVNGGTSNIVFNSTAAQASLNPGSNVNNTYYKVTQAGTNELLINYSITLNELQNTAQPTTISFVEGFTCTVDKFNVSGTAGNLVTLKSKTPGSQFTLAKRTGGKVLVSYCSITDSAATPAGYWFAPTSQGNVDGGNNTGWNFGTAGGVTSGFFPFF
jgi:hypothetical protein